MKQERKRGYHRGEHTTKMMSFKIDTDLYKRLQNESNKGRLINNLLRNHYEVIDIKNYNVD